MSFLYILLLLISLFQFGLSEYIANQKYVNIDEYLKWTRNKRTPANDDIYNKIVINRTILECNNIYEGLVTQCDEELYFLHKNQLFLVNVRTENKTLSQVVSFLPFSENVTDFDVGAFSEDVIIVVIALKSHYNVYRVFLNESESKEQVPAQKINLIGESKKISFYTQDNRLFCLLANEIENGQSLISIYTWQYIFLKLVNTVEKSGIDWVNIEFIQDAIIILSVDYRYSKHEKTSIEIMDSHLNTLQILYNNDNYINILQVDGILKLVSCLERRCFIYRWDESHFIQQKIVNVDYEITKIISRHRYLSVNSEKHLFLYNQIDLRHPIKFDFQLCDNTQEFLIRSKYNKLYLVLTGLEKEKFVFHFFEIKDNDFGKMDLGLDTSGTSFIDPVEKIISCGDQLKIQFDHVFLLINKINTILPNIVTKDLDRNFTKIIVNGKTTINNLSQINQIQLGQGQQITKRDLIKLIETIKEEQVNIKTKAKKIAYINHLYAFQDSLLKSEYNPSNKPAIRVIELFTSSPTFANIFHKKSNEINSNVKMRSLVSNIETEDQRINEIPLSSLCFKEICLRLFAKKQINTMYLQNLNIGLIINNQSIDSFFIKNIPLKALTCDKVQTTHLSAHQINGLNFGTFIRNVFMKFIPNQNKITGDLIISSLSKIKQISANLLNGVPVDSLFTIFSDQEINREVVTNQFFVHNMEAKQINYIDFSKEVAISGESNVLNGPIIIESMKIQNKLILSENEDGKMARHIVGTKIEDLSQMYKGRVIIEGNLIVNKVMLKNYRNLFVQKQRLLLKNGTSYWMKNSHRKFENVTFTGIIKMPQLSCKYVNDHLGEYYLKTTEKSCEKNINLRFQNTRIHGNVVIDRVKTSLISQISRDAVRIREKVIVSGKKQFGTVIVDQLLTTFVNDQRISKLFLKSNSLFLVENKIKMRELYINSTINIKSNYMKINSINHHKFNDIINNAEYTNRPINLLKAKIKYIIVNKFNSANINSYDANYSVEKLFNINFVINANNVKTNQMDVDRINDVLDIRHYFSLLYQKDNEQQIGGCKNFIRGIGILENLSVQNLSQINVSYWLGNVLRNNTDQKIIKNWLFSNIKTPRVYVNSINSVPVTNLIDSVSYLEIPHNLTVNDLVLKNVEIKSFPNNEWNEIKYRLNNLIINKWDRLNITENIYFPEGNSMLWNLLTNAVKSDRLETITKKIIFKKPVYIRDLTINDKKINKIQIKSLIKDTLLKSSQRPQTIFGDNSFNSDVVIRKFISNDIIAKSLDNLNVFELNSSIWRSQTDFQKPVLKFEKLKVSKLNTYRTINNIIIKNLATISNIHNADLSFDTNFVVRGDIFINVTNNLPMDHLLINRAKLSSEKNQDFIGEIAFENLIIDGKSTIFSLNDVEMDSIIFSDQFNHQDIIGVKKFNNVYLKGPSSVTYLNKFNLLDTYKKSVNKAKMQHLKELSVENLKAEDGLVIKKHLNNIPMEYLKHQPIITLPNINQTRLTLKSLLSSYNHRKHQKRQGLVQFDHVKDIEVLYPDESDDCKNKNKCYCKRQTEINMTRTNKIQIQHKDIDMIIKSYNGVNILLKPCKSVNGETTITIQIFDQELQYKIKGVLEYVDFLKLHSLLQVYAIIGIKSDTEFKIGLLNIWNKNVSISYSISFPNVQKASVHTIYSKRENLIIVSTVSYKNERILRLYKFTPKDKKFNIQQAIPFYYSIIQDTTIDNQMYLYLSKAGSKFIEIYQINNVDAELHLKMSLFQKLIFTTTIVDLTNFLIEECYFIAVLFKDSSVEIYKYHYLQGWIQWSYGHSENVKNAERIYYTTTGDTFYLMIVGSEVELISVHV